MHCLPVVKMIVIFTTGSQASLGKLRHFGYGIQMYDLDIDQICRLVENPDMDRGMRKVQKSVLHLYLVTHGQSMNAVNIIIAGSVYITGHSYS